MPLQRQLRRLQKTAELQESEQMNRMYENMLAAARERLFGKEPAKIAEQSGAVLRDGKYCLKSLAAYAAVTPHSVQISDSFSGSVRFLRI